MTEPSAPSITGYHAHIYFDASTLAQAQALCEPGAELEP